MAMQKFLFERGFWVGAIRYPSVPRGSACLRISLQAGHDEKMITKLSENLGNVFSKLGSFMGA